MQYSETAQVIGRSMEPALWEGDCVELHPVSAAEARVGSIYRFHISGLDRPAAHRLVERAIDGSWLHFQGDRQPTGERICGSSELHEVRRVLERRFAPDPAALLFSLAGLCRAEPVAFPRNATERWPWAELLRLSQRHRLTAIVVYVLKRNSLWGSVPEHLRPSFSSGWYEAIQRSAAIEACRRRLLPLLPARHTFLKGASLAGSVYPEPQLRVMEDIDVLVPEAQFRDTAITLESAGFSWTEEHRRIATFYPHTTLVCQETGVSVDLHASPFQPDRFRFHSEELLAGASAELELAYLAAHCYLHWGRHGQSLLDMFLFLAVRKPCLEKAAEIAEGRGALGSFLFACRQLHLWFNVDLPERLERRASAGLRARLAVAEELHAHRMDENLYGFRKHLLQALLSDRIYDFYRLLRSPSRRKMGLSSARGCPPR